MIEINAFKAEIKNFMSLENPSNKEIGKAFHNFCLLAKLISEDFKGFNGVPWKEEAEEYKKDLIEKLTADFYMFQNIMVFAETYEEIYEDNPYLLKMTQEGFKILSDEYEKDINVKDAEVVVEKPVAKKGFFARLFGK
ncbi:MAG: hypothetical protein PHE89_03530 [Alphaproteobacteria bacterium]|nr:hypothetical protein [Alphaproteobacteria bacterium]